MPGCFSCFGGTTRLDGAEDRGRAVSSRQQLPQAHGAASRRQHGSDGQGACSHPAQPSTISPLYQDSSQTFKLDGHHPGAGASIVTQDATGEKALGLGAGLADHSTRHASADHRAHVTETATLGGPYFEQSGSLQLGSVRASSQGLAGTGSLQYASNTGGTSFDTDKSPHNSLVQASIELLDDGVIMPDIGT